MDITSLMVLKNSGEPQERVYAARIIPMVEHKHLLLVTLLLCNAAAMEALPIFLDKMVPSYMAIILSVTAVLFFGEIIPQALCSRYGLAIGYYSAWYAAVDRFFAGWGNREYSPSSAPAECTRDACVPRTYSLPLLLNNEQRLVM